MGTRGPLPSPMRAHLVALYRRGELATLEEGALVAGVTRSAIRAWLRSAGVDWMRARLDYVARHRSRAVAVCEGRIARRPSKAQMRRDGELAKAKWDRDHAQRGSDAAAKQ